MYPSERHKHIIAHAPQEARGRIAEYIDEAYHQGDSPKTYGVRSWKQAILYLVELEGGTQFAEGTTPIVDDYRLYCKIVEEDKVIARDALTRLKQKSEGG